MKENIAEFFIGIFCWFVENFILVPLMILGLIKEWVWPSPYDPEKPSWDASCDYFRDLR